MNKNINRIIHRDNLKILFEDKKLVASNFATRDDYIAIGEKSLIKERSEKDIPLKPCGTILDYISFYFGTNSPMLYCIKNGFDVEKIPQNEIIYLVSETDKIIEHNCEYVFTDGHAFTVISQFYNDFKDLHFLNWKLIDSKYWENTGTEPDRKRIKQAECLIYKEFPLSALTGIAVYNRECYDYIIAILKNYSSNIIVKIKSDYYFKV